MDTNTVNYKKERLSYYKVLIGLLLLTAVTFVQPHMFMTESTFLAQMLIAVVKAWLILMYYMHLKGEKLITAMVWFSLSIVVVFFVIVIGIDVANFQFGAESHITAPAAH
ncbi:MAG: cytochrome C oxidase subunit IV family protein [Campylobacterota bacterium]|nr:cytochrome C oxidase subunit IV family protein [Campylobacterota bacterium]